MGLDHRMAGTAAIAVVVLAAGFATTVGVAGLSAAADRKIMPASQRVAQAVTTPSGTAAAPARAPAPAATPGPGEASATAAAPAPAATLIDGEDVQGILGRKVLSSAGEDMGRVIDIVVDRGGQVRAAVIDFGGFLGVGNRKIAIDWNALHFAPTGSKYDRITLALTREQVKDAPEYKDGRPLVMLGAADPLLAPPE
jgi:PRC-barrel domain protein